jgi:hypothetical protein
MCEREHECVRVRVCVRARAYVCDERFGMRLFRVKGLGGLGPQQRPR